MVWLQSISLHIKFIGVHILISGLHLDVGNSRNKEIKRIQNIRLVIQIMQL